MTVFDHDAFMREWRGRRLPDGAKISQAEYDLVLAAIEGRWQQDAAKAGEPVWMTIARKLIGQREIPGPKHNSWIASSWGRLGATWFNDDETPWCGLFAAHCLDAAGLAIPKPSLFPRAKAWLDWGKPCAPAPGAIAVFGRDGGGHVGFLAGEGSGNYYVLGGNQSNAVSIAPIARNRALGYRWPASLPAPSATLPSMSGGTISRNEA